jgi:hypothetical protein
MLKDELQTKFLTANALEDQAYFVGIIWLAENASMLELAQLASFYKWNADAAVFIAQSMDIQAERSKKQPIRIM